MDWWVTNDRDQVLCPFCLEYVDGDNMHYPGSIFDDDPFCSITCVKSVVEKMRIFYEEDKQEKICPSKNCRNERSLDRHGYMAPLCRNCIGANDFYKDLKTLCNKCRVNLSEDVCERCLAEHKCCICYNVDLYDPEIYICDSCSH